MDNCKIRKDKECSKRQSVLVTAIGSFSADIVIKNIKKLGYRVVGCDINQKETVVDAYNVDKFYVSPYAKESGKYIKFLKEIIAQENIGYIIPLTDFEIDVINQNRDYLEEQGCIICISSKNTIEICRDKFKTYLKLKQNDLSELIQTNILGDMDKYDDIKYPVVLKPCDGRSSQGLMYISSYTELMSFVNYHDVSHYIIQPKIDGEIITVDVVRNVTNNEIVCIPRKELIRTINGAGTSVYVYNDKIITELSKKIALILDIKGCVNFEFIFNKYDNNYYFIECNPRFSGGVEFSCLTGYDMVKNHLNVFLNKQIDKSIEYPNMFIARKYEEYITCKE